ncbi:MAG: LamG domain-containing protein [Cytophagaceae bacterium]
MKHIISLLLLLLSCNLYAQTLSQKGQYALHLNGENEYLFIQENGGGLLNTGNELTIEAHIRVSDTEGYVAIANKHWCLGRGGSYHFGIRDGKLTFVWTEIGHCDYHASVITTREVIKKNRWTSVAVTFINGEVRLFVNGKIQKADKLGNIEKLNDTEAPILIGSYRKLSGDYLSFFSGEINEFRLWNKARTNIEIRRYRKKSIVKSDNSLLLNLTFEDREVQNYTSYKFDINCIGKKCSNPSNMILKK